MPLKIMILYVAIAILLYMVLYYRARLERACEVGAAAFLYMREELKQPMKIVEVMDWLEKKMEEGERDARDKD